jgi:hypothetical protein
MTSNDLCGPVVLVHPGPPALFEKARFYQLKLADKVALANFDQSRF